MKVDAVVENLTAVQTYVEEQLEVASCSMKVMMQVGVAVEEIFVNIAHYAYGPEGGQVTVDASVSGDPAVITIVFKDEGTPYDPLAKEDPDVTLAAQDRKIGGLGIYMTKKMMDDVAYEYRDGQNILTLKKNLG